MIDKETQDVFDKLAAEMALDLEYRLTLERQRLNLDGPLAHKRVKQAIDAMKAKHGGGK